MAARGLGRIRGVRSCVETNVVERLVGRGDERGAHLGGDPPPLSGKVTCDLPARVPGTHESRECPSHLRGVHEPVGGWGGDQGAQRGVGCRAHLDVVDASFTRENQGREHIVMDETVATRPCAPLGALSRERTLGFAGVAAGLVEAAHNHEGPFKHSRVSHGDEQEVEGADRCFE